MDSSRSGKPIHLVCPKCRYEFEYDFSYYDRKIAQLATEIANINSQLAAFKSTCKPNFKDYKWRARAVQALTVKQAQLKELKEFRKFANETVKNQELQIFARLVKDAIPEELYIKLHRQAEAEMQYHTYEMAVQRYSNIPDSVREGD